jgi:hypothetical protein
MCFPLVIVEFPAEQHVHAAFAALMVAMQHVELTSDGDTFAKKAG